MGRARCRGPVCDIGRLTRTLGDRDVSRMSCRACRGASPFAPSFAGGRVTGCYPAAPSAGRVMI
jgi:hypothetical protein